MASKRFYDSVGKLIKKRKCYPSKSLHQTYLWNRVPRKGRIGKSVQIRHGPATVSDGYSPSAKPLSRMGWEGADEQSQVRRPAPFQFTKKPSRSRLANAARIPQPGFLEGWGFFVLRIALRRPQRKNRLRSRLKKAGLGGLNLNLLLVKP